MKWNSDTKLIWSDLTQVTSCIKLIQILLRPSRPSPVCGWNYPHCSSWPWGYIVDVSVHLFRINYFTVNRVWVSSLCCLLSSPWCIGITGRELSCVADRKYAATFLRRNVTADQSYLHQYRQLYLLPAVPSRGRTCWPVALCSCW